MVLNKTLQSQARCFVKLIPTQVELLSFHVEITSFLLKCRYKVYSDSFQVLSSCGRVKPVCTLCWQINKWLESRACLQHRKLLCSKQRRESIFHLVDMAQNIRLCCSINTILFKSWICWAFRILLSASVHLELIGTLGQACGKTLGFGQGQKNRIYFSSLFII